MPDMGDISDTFLLIYQFGANFHFLPSLKTFIQRFLSIREAARLQTFPDSFVFCGSKDKQYQQVGNAVPPIMAKSIARKLVRQLEKLEDVK